MKTFKQFLNEKFVPPNNGPLYHFIGTHSFHNVLRHDTLSSMSYNHPDWSPTNPSPIMIKDGSVSLTRDSGLNFSNRPIRLKINRHSLIKSGHTPEEYYDPFMHVPGDWSRDIPAHDPMVPHEMKHIESEERVRGHIPNLDDHLIEIGILKSEHENLHRSIKSSQEYLQNLQKKKEMASKGYFWHTADKKFKKIENDRQQNVAKRTLEDDGKYHHDNIKKSKMLLSHPKLRTYERFE